jgi:Ni/Co efflux regulator RcnB
MSDTSDNNQQQSRTTMKTKLVLSVLLAATLAAPALAANADAKAPTTQQQRMKACNAEAKGKALKGDDRRSFMSGCLKGASATSAGGAGKQAAPRD